jgi:hypothetical protein
MNLRLLFMKYMDVFHKKKSLASHGWQSKTQCARPSCKEIGGQDRGSSYLINETLYLRVQLR